MGEGEDVMMRWHDWFEQLSEAQADDYFRHYIPPMEWQDWCEFQLKRFRDSKNG